jgi:hypothetical protein
MTLNFREHLSQNLLKKKTLLAYLTRALPPLLRLANGKAPFFHFMLNTAGSYDSSCRWDLASPGVPIGMVQFLAQIGPEEALERAVELRKDHSPWLSTKRWDPPRGKRSKAIWTADGY